MVSANPSIIPENLIVTILTGLENSTQPLVFTSTKGCRASENFEISSENQILPIYANNFCDAGKVSIFRYFEACLIFTFLIVSIKKKKIINLPSFLL